MVWLICSKQSLMIWFAIDLVYVRENYSRFRIGRGKEYEPAIEKRRKRNGITKLKVSFKA